MRVATRLPTRLYATRQTIRSRPGKTLDAAPTEKAKYFAFGNFAALHKPDKKQLERATSAVDKIASFDALRIFPTVRAAMVGEILAAYNFKNTYVKSKDELQLKPLPVQIAAIRKINRPRKPVERDNAVFSEVLQENERNRLKIFTVAAETGLGKTWAYLASIFSKLKEDDLALYNRAPRAYRDAMGHQTIRLVVLLPTHELVEQVYNTAHKAATLALDEDAVSKKVRSSGEYARFLAEPHEAASLNLNVVKWGTGDSHNVLFDKIRQRRIDVLVTTPAKIQSLAKLNNVPRPFRAFGHVDYCVVDEADTLMDESWRTDTLTTIQRFARLKDLVMCSATIPREFQKSLRLLVKDESSIIPIVTPQIHKIPKQIVLKVIDAQQLPYNGSKTRCLAQAIYAIHNDGSEAGFVKRILVFVNEKKNVEPLVETLVSKFGHREEDVVGVTGKDDAAERRDKLEPFINSATPLEQDPDGSKIKILVTTDLLARGLNFQGIKNVILMDLPRTSVDLIHRVGRTGRMRQSGRVFIIIDKKTKKSWIKGLPKAVRNGATLG